MKKYLLRAAGALSVLLFVVLGSLTVIGIVQSDEGTVQSDGEQEDPGFEGTAPNPLEGFTQDDVPPPRPFFIPDVIVNVARLEAGRIECRADGPHLIVTGRGEVPPGAELSVGRVGPPIQIAEDTYERHPVGPEVSLAPIRSETADGQITVEVVLPDSFRSGSETFTISLYGGVSRDGVMLGSNGLDVEPVDC